MKRPHDEISNNDINWSNEILNIMIPPDNNNESQIIKNFKEGNQENALEVVKQCCYMIKYVQKEFLTNEICEEAVSKNGLLLCYVKNKTFNICKLALLNNVRAITYIENSDIESMDKTNNSTYEKKLELISIIIRNDIINFCNVNDYIKKDLLKNIKLKTNFNAEECFIYLIYENSKIFSLLNVPLTISNEEYLKFLKYILKYDPHRTSYINYITLDMCMELSHIDFKLFDYLNLNLLNKEDNLSLFKYLFNLNYSKTLELYNKQKQKYYDKELQLYLIKIDGRNLKFFINSFKSKKDTQYVNKLVDIAVKNNLNSIKYITHTILAHITYEKLNEIYMTAVNKDGTFLEYVYYQTDEICKLAILNNPLVLRYVTKQSHELCNLAFKLDVNSFKYSHLSIEYNDLIDKNITMKLDECPVCKEIKEQYYQYKCNEKHIICVDCGIKYEHCYFKCDKQIDFSIMYINENFETFESD